jgi:hypothetical protein
MDLELPRLVIGLMTLLYQITRREIFQARPACTAHDAIVAMTIRTANNRGTRCR